MTCLAKGNSVDYIGETERPLHVRFAEHHRKLTQAELRKIKNPTKRIDGCITIDEHEPSAVSAHAMIEHNGEYHFAIGVLSVKRQQDQRKAYEILSVGKYKPSMNKQLTKDNNVFPQYQ
jgi:hypothetical protein